MNRILLTIGLLLVTGFAANAQWVTTGGPTGTTNTVVADGSNLMAGTGTGVFLSTDNGTSWIESSSGLSANVQAIAVNGSNIYAGTYGSGVYMSTNHGASWSAANSGLTGFALYVWTFLVSGTDILAGTSNGVYISTNSGTTWLPRNTGITGTTVVSMLMSGTDVVVGTNNNGVYVSTNSGVTWLARSSGMTSTSVWGFSVIGNGLFAGSNGGGVFLSTNSGVNWVAVNTGLANLHVLAMMVSGSGLLAGTQGDGVYLSTDSGSNWMAANTGLPAGQIHSLLISGADIFVAAGYDGVWRRPLSQLITDVHSTGGKPAAFELHPNHPNPFNPSTLITYRVPHAGHVRLSVYNLLGAEVRTLVNTFQSSGLKFVSWDGTNNRRQAVSSGMYLYRLEAGHVAITRKMLLLK